MNSEYYRNLIIQLVKQTDNVEKLKMIYRIIKRYLD